MAIAPLDWTRHPLGLAGAVLTTVSAVLILGVFAIGLAGYEGGPYLGVVAYTVLPVFFITGLALIPIGLRLERKRMLRFEETGIAEPPLPIVDLNQPRTRRHLIWVAGLSVVNLMIVALAGYEGLHVMDSPAFCGSCHSVMDPEFTTYQASPHARVACVECHIGSGASWFVKSKLSGAKQLIAVVAKTYPRPIPTPVQNLRPARDTCERCHWPTKFVGDRLKVISHFGDDQANTETKTVMLLRVGGGAEGKAEGIHKHVDPEVRIRYASDPSRENIGAVEASLPGGTQRTYAKAGAPSGAWRTMDCIDCHNRPTHVYRTAEGEVDAALATGQLDRAMPFLHREGLKVLRADYPSHEAARGGIRQGLKDFYGKSFPAVAADRVEAAAARLGDIYARNVYPSMRIAWGTYPSLLGHNQVAGCFRCHDEEHKAADGRTLSQDCTLCHTLLAVDEKEPAVLKQLRP